MSRSTSPWSGRAAAVTRPCGPARTTARSCRASTRQAGEVIANNVIAPISDEGTVCFYSSVGTDFVVDVTGWFVGADGRTTSSRSSGSCPSAASTPATVSAAGRPRSRRRAADDPGRRRRRAASDGTSVTVPADAAAVAVNVTVTQASTKGFATVWPCGRPDRSRRT